MIANRINIILIFLIFCSANLYADDLFDLIRPPFDAKKQVWGDKKLIRDGKHKEPKTHEEAIMLYKSYIQKAPDAGDIDYCIVWLTRELAQAGRLDECLQYYKLMRKYFSGYLHYGAKGATRNWDVHLAVTKLYVERSNDPKSKEIIKEMDKADKNAKPVDTDLLYINYTPMKIDAFIPEYVRFKFNSKLEKIEATYNKNSRNKEIEFSLLGLWRFNSVTVVWEELFSLRNPGKKTFKVKGKDIPTLDKICGFDLPRGLYYIIIQTEDLIDAYYIVADPKPGISAMIEEPPPGMEVRFVPVEYHSGKKYGGAMFVPKITQSINPETMSLLRDEGDLFLENYLKIKPLSDSGSGISFMYDKVSGQVNITGGHYHSKTNLSILGLWRFDEEKELWTVALPLSQEPKAEIKLCIWTNCNIVNKVSGFCNVPPKNIPLNDILRFELPTGLYYIAYQIDNYPIAGSIIFNGPVPCIDVCIGRPPPEGMIATCVPRENSALARFVPDPRNLIDKVLKK